MGRLGFRSHIQVLINNMKILEEHRQSRHVHFWMLCC